MNAEVRRVYIERSTLIVKLAGDMRPALNSPDGLSQLEPSFYRCSDDGAEAWFNLASCMHGKCLSGSWVMSGVTVPDGIEGAYADFSKGSCKFEVTVSCTDTVNVDVDYVPTKVGLRDKLITFGLRTPYFVAKLFRGRRRRILFTSETRASLSGNMEYVINAADGDFGGNKILYSFKSGKSRLMFYIKTSFLAGLCHTVAVDDYYPLIYRLSFGSDRVIQLWHACGAFKTVGYSRLGKSGAPQPDDITHRNYTHVTVSSEEIIPYYAEAFGIPADRLIATGVPRTDPFFDDAENELKRARFFERFPQFGGRTIVLFAPTFRGDGFKTAHYPAEMIDFERLAECCRQNGMAVVFKMHPFVHGFGIPDGYADVFADAGDIREINDILIAADLLITDYSSVIYEYSLLGRPIIFYTFDLEEYQAGRNFYMPIESYAEGCTVSDLDGIIRLLESGGYKDLSAEKIRRHSMSACDGKAARRVAKLIFKSEK